MPDCVTHCCWAKARVHAWCIAVTIRMCLGAVISGIYGIIAAVLGIQLVPTFVNALK